LEIRNRPDFMRLKKEGIICPVCQEKCKCNNCKKELINEDLQKLKKEIHQSKANKKN
jgi:hypothetical protein